MYVYIYMYMQFDILRKGLDPSFGPSAHKYSQFASMVKPNSVSDLIEMGGSTSDRRKKWSIHHPSAERWWSQDWWPDGSMVLKDPAEEFTIPKTPAELKRKITPRKCQSQDSYGFIGTTPQSLVIFGDQSRVAVPPNSHDAHHFSVSQLHAVHRLRVSYGLCIAPWKRCCSKRIQTPPQPPSNTQSALSDLANSATKKPSVAAQHAAWQAKSVPLERCIILKHEKESKKIGTVFWYQHWSAHSPFTKPPKGLSLRSMSCRWRCSWWTPETGWAGSAGMVVGKSTLNR